MTDTDDLRAMASTQEAGGAPTTGALLRWAAGRIDQLERELAREQEAYGDIAYELKNETGVVMEQMAEIERLTRFSVVVRRHLGDDATNELWKMTHSTTDDER
jgi:hypothetical protein